MRRVLLAKEHAGLFDAARRGDLTRAFRAPCRSVPRRSPRTIKRPAPAPLPAPPAALVGAAPSVGVIQWTLPATPPAHTAYYSLQAWYYQGSSPVMVATLPRLDPGVYHSVTMRAPVGGVRYFARLSAHTMAGSSSAPSPQAAVTALYDLPALPRIRWSSPARPPRQWYGPGLDAAHTPRTEPLCSTTRVARPWWTAPPPCVSRSGAPPICLVACWAPATTCVSSPLIPMAWPHRPYRPPPTCCPARGRWSRHPGLAGVGRTQTLAMWRWAAQPNAAAYRVRLSHLEAGTTVVDIALRLPRGQTRLTATALAPGATYHLTVWAVANTGRWSDPATAQIPTLALPTPPARDPRGPRIARLPSAGGGQ